MNKLCLLQILTILASMIFSHQVMASRLRSRVVVEKVKISPEYTHNRWVRKRSHRCQKFKGTYDQSEIHFKVKGLLGSGKYKHTLVYRLNNSYDYHGDPQKHIVKEAKKKNVIFKITLPKLKNDVPYVQQNFSIITEDRKKDTVVKKNMMVNTHSNNPIPKNKHGY